MKIVPDDVTHPDVLVLLNEHLADMASQSPEESMHALGAESLRSPDIDFFSAWENGKLAGCAGLKYLDETHGEIKSMRTAQAFRGKGLGRHLLTHLIGHARKKGLTRLSLETGSMDFFEPARQLYLQFGFKYCDPFADYVLDPNSVFMTLALDAKPSEP